MHNNCFINYTYCIVYTHQACDAYNEISHRPSHTARIIKAPKKPWEYASMNILPPQPFLKFQKKNVAIFQWKNKNYIRAFITVAEKSNISYTSVYIVYIPLSLFNRKKKKTGGKAWRRFLISPLSSPPDAKLCRLFQPMRSIHFRRAVAAIGRYRWKRVPRDCFWRWRAQTRPKVGGRRAHQTLLRCRLEEEATTISIAVLSLSLEFYTRAVCGVYKPRKIEAKGREIRVHRRPSAVQLRPDVQCLLVPGALSTLHSLATLNL